MIFSTVIVFIHMGNYVFTRIQFALLTRHYILKMPLAATLSYFVIYYTLIDSPRTLAHLYILTQMITPYKFT
jgi:hypothetical protein